MKVNEFIEEYKKLDKDGQTSFITDLVTVNYVSYATKISDCKRIIDSTSYTNTEPNMFRINSPARHMLLNLQLIDRYTDIEIDFENALEIFDMLDEVDALRNILVLIPPREMENYNRIMEMMLKDFQINERSLVGYIDSKMASLSILGDAFDKMIENVSI